MNDQEIPFGRRGPWIRTPPPGPVSSGLAARLSEVESRNVTYLGPDFPVFWAEARGANVRDADGNEYVDLTGAFGVAVAGHNHPEVVNAVQEQAPVLTHGMGDVHPPARKVELLERLDALLPWPEGRTVLASSGSEAVEIALKTALLATDRPGILAFQGGYHGLTLGALATTAREDFRHPFRSRMYGGVRFAPFPADTPESGQASLEAVSLELDRARRQGEPVGAILLEPIQGRGGVRVPPAGFLAELAALGREHGALLVLDEIYTG
ncbi:MAG: aminotransferase class III-fold pyridoxal phosphate-dependent enzyme, partial [Gemmatimonadales bacterium]